MFRTMIWFAISIALANSVVFAQGFTGAISVQKRASRGLALKANYTFAKGIDLNSALLAPAGENEPAAVFTPYNLRLNRGLTAYIVQHQFNANFSYQLPFGKDGAGGARNQLIGGWRWNWIFTAQTGFPFTALVGSNTSGTGDSSTNSDAPNWNPNFRGSVTLGTTDHWFDPQAFRIPAYGTFGNVSRGSLLGPGLFDIDTSLFKKFRINERFNLQFRAEAFNISNHTNFSYPNPIVFSAGQVSSAAFNITSTNGTSRQLQLALKLLF